MTQLWSNDERIYRHPFFDHSSAIFWKISMNCCIPLSFDSSLKIRSGYQKSRFLALTPLRHRRNGESWLIVFFAFLGIHSENLFDSIITIICWNHRVGQLHIILGLDIEPMLNEKWKRLKIHKFKNPRLRNHGLECAVD